MIKSKINKKDVICLTSFLFLTYYILVYYIDIVYK